MMNSSMKLAAVCGGLIWALMAVASALAAESDIHFNRDVRPILSDNCFACHGFDAKQRKADLRLDRQEGAYAKGKGGKVAIVPGDLKGSELWRRINATD